MKYHGHQFRVYNPEIGDGRGFTIAQFYKDKKLFDLGTKGSGKTVYSRSGDGRLTLKGGVENLLKSHLPEIKEVVALNGCLLYTSDAADE